MNNKLNAINTNNIDDMIKYFYRKKQNIEWKNCKYFWCCNCKTKYKYCQSCQKLLEKKLVLINCKENAIKYICNINKKLEININEELIKLIPLSNKYRQEIIEYRKNKNEIIHNNICKIKKLKEEKIKNENEIKLKYLDEAHKELEKINKRLKINTLKPNYIIIKNLLKNPLKELLSFYDLRYCLLNNNTCNNSDRHLHFINKIIACNDLLNGKYLYIYGHLGQLSIHISKLFCIPLKYDIILKGNNTKLINKFNKKEVDLCKGMTVLMNELYLNLSNSCLKYLNINELNININKKLKNCIIYPIVLIRKLLLLIN